MRASPTPSAIVGDAVARRVADLADATVEDVATRTANAFGVEAREVAAHGIAARPASRLTFAFALALAFAFTFAFAFTRWLADFTCVADGAVEVHGAVAAELHVVHEQRAEDVELRAEHDVRRRRVHVAADLGARGERHRAR